MKRHPFARGALVLCVSVVLVANSGCGKDEAPTSISDVRVPPQIDLLQPPARSQRIPQNTPIWVQFKEPLTAASVNTRTVFLKVDSRRLAIDVAYEVSTRRILILPKESLDLAVIYTVELSKVIKTAAGVELGQNFRWQFRTLAARFPAGAMPLTQTVGRSPVAPLAWVPTEPSVKQIVYEIYAGADSLAVATRAVPPTGRTKRMPYFPAQTWPRGQRIYWMVSALNEEFGEHVDGSVSWFETVPAGARVDSVLVPASEWSWVTQFGFVACHGFSLTINQYCVIRWQFSGVSPALNLANARMEVSATDPNIPGLSLWYTVGPWSECAIGTNGPPFTDAEEGRLAFSVRVTPNRTKFESPAFAAHVSAAIAGLGVDGYMIRTGIPTPLVSPTGAPLDQRPSLKVYYYPDFSTAEARAAR